MAVCGRSGPANSDRLTFSYSMPGSLPPASVGCYRLMIQPEAEVAESATHNDPELRRRRSTRIVQAVPLTVTGVDALGRPFTERTSTLIINCHGCRYQSKHYVLKNMWVTLEIPHSEGGQP